MRRFDVIVTGGGIAGLIAAAFAAQGGASVLLLEASPEFGGRAKTRIDQGYHFNQGPHALYRGGFLDTAVRNLGVALTGDVPALAGGFFINDGTLHQAPVSAAGLAATTLLPAAEKAVAALADAGVVSDPPTVPDWDAAVADAKSLAALPFFPAEWFAADPRVAAERAVELYRAVQEARELAAKLPEFDIAAVKQESAIAAVSSVLVENQDSTMAGAMTLALGPVRRIDAPSSRTLAMKRRSQAATRPGLRRGMVTVRSR